MHFIYCIENTINGKCYIGQTNDPKRRWKDHRVKLRNGTSNSPMLQHAVDKYGIEVFKFTVIESDIPTSEINEREKFWIAEFDSQNTGYNVTAGGEDRGYKGIPCTWNGVTYPSISVAAMAIGIDSASMWNRIHRGYTCDGDMPNSNVPCEWNGVKYLSITDAANANGIAVTAMSNRVSKGYKSESDMVFNRKKVSWNGILYPSIQYAAQVLGITHASMAERIRKGYACDDDLKSNGKRVARKPLPQSVVNFIRSVHEWTAYFA